MIRKSILFLCILLFISGCGKTKDIYPKQPKDTPYFYNETSIQEVNTDICTELRRAKALTDIEFVVALLKKVPQGTSIESYAAGLFDKWRIGYKTRGKGILIIFVEDKHTLKIEVSYEMEGIFTDAFCASYQPTIKSYYAGRYFGDVFTDLILWMERKIIEGEEATYDEELKSIFAKLEPLKLPDTFLSGGAGIIDDEYYYEKETKLSLIRQIPEEKIREFESDEDIGVTLKRYFKLLEEGHNYPFLGIFTEGSQMMRLEYPRSVHFFQSQWQDYQKLFPYRIVYNDKKDLAVVRFKKGLVWPIFLRKNHEGLWKLDVTKAWAFSQANHDLTEIYPRYTDHPWMFAYPEYSYKKSECHIPKLIPFPLKIREKITALEETIEKKPTNAANYFKLADIFFWECYWIRAAIDVVEQGLELEPDNTSYRWLVIYMRYRFPEVEHIPMHYEALLKIDPGDRRVLRSYSWHCWFYTMEYKNAVRLSKKNKSDYLSKRNLKIYKKNYWEQVARDKNLISKIWNYFYIFYVNRKVLYVTGVVLLIALVLVFRKSFSRLGRLNRLLITQKSYQPDTNDT